MSDLQQVGTTGVNGVLHAGLWSGTSDSWVDLNPLGATHSEAYGVCDGQQVGFAEFGTASGSHASLWSGTAGSWVDLSPDSVGDSVAYASNGAQQVGAASTGTIPFSAALWSGSADSWVSLGDGIHESAAFAISGAHQAGYVNLGEQHACFWSGTAASLVDLNPVGATQSVVYGASGELQVGWSASGELGSTRHAGVWSGTAASWVDLHAFLPPGSFRYSSAQAVWTDGTTIRVSGFAADATHVVAVLWTRPCAGSVCPADLDCSGTVTTADILAFLSDWFAGDLAADFNHADGITVADIFDFLNAWFAGC
jgi:hypothetical protein